MKTTSTFMTVPNLFCQRAATGQDLDVLVDRPLAFIHVQDAAEALLRAVSRLDPLTDENRWQVVNAAPEVATIGQLARIVQRLAQERGSAVRINGAAASEATFAVHSALGPAFEPGHRLANDLAAVLDRFRKSPCES